jgi:hypothetical protein
MHASHDELRSYAAARGVNLLHAYLRAGIHDSTYYRHRDKRNGMTVATYNALMKAIDQLAQARNAA